MSLATPVHEQSITEISAAIARGDLTPSDLMDAVLDRVARVDQKVHAWSYLDADGARAQANALTAEAAAGKLRGPLHGIPIGVKDEFHVKGMPTGMRDLPVPVPEPEDATCVARLKAAGAIILGKTYMPVNSKTPPTRNPWNQEYTAGGTSSGSGASVGARMVPVAIGEQTMGSNLRPAAYCGCAGLKPTYGRISRFGCFPFAWSLDHVGLIGQSFPDVAIVLNAIAGPDPKDPTAFADPPPPADLNLASFPRPRIGVVRNFFLERSEPVMQQAVEQAATQLKAAGAAVSDCLLPDEFRLTWLADRIVSAGEGATFHADHHEERELSGSAGRSGALVPATYYLQARRVRSWLLNLLHDRVFGDFDAILMPTTPAPAPKAPNLGNATLLVPWSFLGLPAITYPAGLSPEGLPLGLQFVGDRRSDYQMLRIGGWCEQVLGRLPAPALD